MKSYFWTSSLWGDSNCLQTNREADQWLESRKPKRSCGPRRWKGHSRCWGWRAVRPFPWIRLQDRRKQVQLARAKMNSRKIEKLTTLIFLEKVPANIYLLPCLGIYISIFLIKHIFNTFKSIEPSHTTWFEDKEAWIDYQSKWKQNDSRDCSSLVVKV